MKQLRFPTVCLQPFIVLAALLLLACSHFIERLPGEPVSPAEDSDVLRLVAQLASANSGLEHFKGVGNCVVRRGGVKQIDERAAWIASAPDKISVVFFISGFPAIRFASDGEYVYYNDFRNDRASYRKARASSSNMSYVLGISINPTEFIRLLAGRVPLESYYRAELTPDPLSDGYVLTLRKWWGIFQKVVLSPDKMTVRSLESFSRNGSLRYRARFIKWQKSGEFTVPAVLRISNNGTEDVELTIDRYWSDAVVDPSIFVIPPPDS